MINLIFAALLGGCVKTNNPQDSVSLSETANLEESPIHWDECSYRIGEHICNIELTANDGKIWSLYENHGRPIIIDLSAVWCPVCKISAPEAEKFMERWSEYDLLWVTILIENAQGDDPTASDLALWESDYGVQDSIILAGSRDLLDIAGDDGFPMTSWPTFVILTDDLLIFHGVGGWSEQYLEQKLTEMLVIQ